jgi:hypothetical protein
MRRTRIGKAAVVWAAVLIGAGCSRPSEPRQEPVRSSDAAAVGPVLDIPSLLPLSIDVLTRRLGPSRPIPPGFSDPSAVSLSQIQARLDSTAFFQSHGLSLVVAYDASQRHINDILLLGTDEDLLMRQGRLRMGAPDYLVLPVFQAHRPMQLLGVRVVAFAPASAR